MTEAEWLAATDPTPMLEFLEGRVGDRKLRLFAVACCRRIWPLLPRDESRRAVEVAEGFADAAAGEAELDEAWDAARAVADLYPEEAAAYAAFRDAAYAAECASEYATYFAADPAAETAAQADLLRCVVGNPFRPVVLDPAWLTSDVVALATGIYDEAAFDRLPILADALQDAGCDNEDVLGHCRGAGPHVRGCWVIDLVLGKR